jgi:hypothetical protein
MTKSPCHDVVAREARKYPFFARHAATIVDNGYSIVAVLPGTKRPRFRKWQAACFMDTEALFLSRHFGKYPDDSIGIACGTKKPSTLISPISLGQTKSIVSQ